MIFVNLLGLVCNLCLKVPKFKGCIFIVKSWIISPYSSILKIVDIQRFYLCKNMQYTVQFFLQLLECNRLEARFQSLCSKVNIFVKFNLALKLQVNKMQDGYLVNNIVQVKWCYIPLLKNNWLLPKTNMLSISIWKCCNLQHWYIYITSYHQLMKYFW